VYCEGVHSFMLQYLTHQMITVVGGCIFSCVGLVGDYT